MSAKLRCKNWKDSLLFKDYDYRRQEKKMEVGVGERMKEGGKEKEIKKISIYTYLRGTGRVILDLMQI